jgi:hypothetical protein
MSQMKYFPGSYRSFDGLTLSEHKGVRRSLGYIAPLFVSFQHFSAESCFIPSVTVARICVCIFRGPLKSPQVVGNFQLSSSYNVGYHCKHVMMTDLYNSKCGPTEDRSYTHCKWHALNPQQSHNM